MTIDISRWNFTEWDAPGSRVLRHAWVHGESRPSGDATLSSVNPATGRLCGEFDDGGSEIVEVAVASARDAFRNGWSRMSGVDRAAILVRWAERIAEATDSLADLETLEVGRPTTDARALISQAPMLIGYYASMIAALEEPTEGAMRRPRGVIGAITPWNFPVANVLIRVAPILAAGNTLVLKASELSPRSAVFLAQLATEAGMPDGVFNVTLGGGLSTGEALVAHPDVDMIAFTGSTVTGQSIIRASATNTLKPLVMECGGKSAQIVLPDMVDQPDVWSGVFAAAFWNTGQWCAARSRLLVPTTGLESAIEGLKSASEGWSIGDPRLASTRLGPLASRKQFETVKGYLNIATDTARVVPLTCPIDERADGGFYVDPVLVLDAPQDGALVQQEVFGPLLSIQTYNDLDHAISLADDSIYGLGATVWGSNQSDASRIAERLTVGSVDIMTSASARAAPALGMPFEPRKQSGFGVEGGLAGLATFTTPQAISYVG